MPTPPKLRSRFAFALVAFWSVGLLALAATAMPAQAFQGAGDLVVTCPDGTVMEGEDQDLTCTQVTTVDIDALEGSNGTFLCRDGSTGEPTSADPTCQSEVRNSIRPILTCNGNVVTVPGDGDDCLVDTDQDGILDGDDFAPLDPNVSEAPETPTLLPLATPGADLEAPSDDADGDLGDDEPEDPSDDVDESGTTDAESDAEVPDEAASDTDDGEANSSAPLIGLGLLFVLGAALAWLILRSRGNDDDSVELNY